MTRGQEGAVRVDWQRLFNHKPWIEARRRLIYTDFKHPFSQSPLNLLRKLRLPTIAVELPRITVGPHKPFPAKWWTIRWKQGAVLGELRVQQRRLFRHAPDWSPLRSLAFPALRFSFRKSKSPSFKARAFKGMKHSH